MTLFEDLEYRGLIKDISSDELKKDQMKKYIQLHQVFHQVDMFILVILEK